MTETGQNVERTYGFGQAQTVQHRVCLNRLNNKTLIKGETMQFKFVFTIRNHFDYFKIVYNNMIIVVLLISNVVYDGVCVFTRKHAEILRV